MIVFLIRTRLGYMSLGKGHYCASYVDTCSDANKLLEYQQNPVSSYLPLYMERSCNYSVLQFVSACRIFVDARRKGLVNSRTAVTVVST